MTDWDQILTEHGPSVWRIAHRLLGHAHDADDCLQEVFLSALEYSRHAQVRNWAAFLRASVTNRALDRLRTRTRQGDRFRGTTACEAVPSNEPNPEQRARVVELAERLRVALGRLPAKDVEVFCLCCVVGMEHRDVAEVLRIKIGTVYARLHRARKRLRELLAPALPDSERS